MFGIFKFIIFYMFQSTCVWFYGFLCDLSLLHSMWCYMLVWHFILYALWCLRLRVYYTWHVLSFWCVLIVIWSILSDCMWWYLRSLGCYHVLFDSFIDLIYLIYTRFCIWYKSGEFDVWLNLILSSEMFCFLQCFIECIWFF